MRELTESHVVGLSFGAGLALELYRRHPGLPVTLVLASAYAGRTGSLPAEVVEQRLKQALRLADLPPDRLVEELIPTMFTDSAPAELVEGFAASMREFHPVGLRANSRAFANAGLRDVLSTIDVPTLLLYGDRDVRAPRNVALTSSAVAPHGTLISRLSSSCQMRLLVVEDDVKMAALVRRGLTEEGAAVDVARSGEDALWMAASASYDALVLDVMLPGIDGFETCRRLREDGVWTPVLLLTARDSVEDRVAGLDGGADDYLTKPFSFAELSARLRALVRRGQKERPAVLEVGELRLDPATRQAWRDKHRIELSTKEFALLEAFMRRPDDVLSRLELLEHAWDFGYENRSNVIDVYVRYLREKIDRPFGVKSIETVRGAGYRLRADGGAS